MTAKEFLAQYRTLDARISAIQREIDELRRRAVYISPVGRDESRGSGAYDKVGELTARIVDLQLEMTERLNKLFDLKAEIERAIGTLPDERQRLVLTLRYIDGYSFRKIAEKLYYGLDNVFAIHRKALRNIKVYSKIQ